MVPSTLTYLMLTVTVVDMETTATHEVRYPITADDPELMDDDNDGVPNTFEFPGQMNSPTNLMLTDMNCHNHEGMITVPSGTSYRIRR